MVINMRFSRWGRALREALVRFMAGRYGADSFYYFLLGVYFVLLVINLFVGSYIIYLLELAALIYAVFRAMSRNIYKRQRENQWFLRVSEKPRGYFKLLSNKWRDRRTHVYKRCPSCKNNLRLPKVSGKHTVVCPCCKHRFDVKI